MPKGKPDPTSLSPRVSERAAGLPRKAQPPKKKRQPKQPKAIAGAKGVRIIPVRTPIPESERVLGQAVVAQVEYTSDGVIIRSEELDEDGYGATEAEALSDLLTSLGDHYDSLRHHAERLSDWDRLILARLGDVINTTHLI